MSRQIQISLLQTAIVFSTCGRHSRDLKHLRASSFPNRGNLARDSLREALRIVRCLPMREDETENARGCTHRKCTSREILGHKVERKRRTGETAFVAIIDIFVRIKRINPAGTQSASPMRCDYFLDLAFSPSSSTSPSSNLHSPPSFSQLISDNSVISLSVSHYRALNARSCAIFPFNILSRDPGRGIIRSVLRLEQMEEVNIATGVK